MTTAGPLVLEIENRLARQGEGRGLAKRLDVETRLAYYGLGVRIHVYLGHPSLGWWCLCGGAAHNVSRRFRDYSNEELPVAPKGVVADCARCAKRAGLVEVQGRTDLREARAVGYARLRTAYQAAVDLIDTLQTPDDPNAEQAEAWEKFEAARDALKEARGGRR